jgi:hypothetical protein
MKEAEWSACTDPEAMLAFLGGAAVKGHHLGRDARNRKLWLFAAACSRRATRFLPDEILQAATSISDRLGEGMASSSDRRTAWEAFARWKERFVMEQDFERAALLYEIQKALAPLTPPFPSNPTEFLAKLDDSLVGAEGRAMRAARWAYALPQLSPSAGWDASAQPRDPGAQEEYLRLACDALRDLFGPLPFRPVMLAPWLLAWQDGTVSKLAQGIAGEQAFDRLPILGDALEEAGCSDGELLLHCRRQGGHVRGCWCVDAILCPGVTIS